MNFFRGHPVDSFKADTIIFQALTKTDYTESIVTESLTLSTPYHQVWSEFFPLLPPWPKMKMENEPERR